MKAACADLVRVSEAALADSCHCRAVSAAATISSKDAEKGAHKLFKIFGLSLNVPISWVELQLNREHLRVPYIKVSDYLKKLLLSYPDCVWAGASNPQQRCKAFWKSYYAAHPTHEAYAHFSENGLGCLIPLAIHGDEGTGSKKQPVSIVNWQSIWGPATARTKHLKTEVFGQCSSCPATSRIGNICQVPQHWPKVCNQEMDLDSTDLLELQSQFPATSGHSFLTRHLVCCLPTYLVKKGPQVLDAVLAALADDMANLFTQGIDVNGTQYYCSLIACKGDQKWHAAVAKLVRSYTST